MGVGSIVDLVQCGFSGYSYFKTRGHIIELMKLYDKFEKEAKPEVAEAVLYVLQKKHRKSVRKFTGMVPMVGGLGNTLFTLGRTIQKKFITKTKGVHREEHAKVLWKNKGFDTLAHRACKELLGEKTYRKLRDNSLGWRYLMAKMKSL
jgi:hypothetical protein